MADPTITRKDVLLYGGAAVGGVVAGSAAVVALAEAVGDKQTPVPGAPIVATYVDGDLPATDPGSGTWNDAAPTLVPLVAQQIAQPFLEEAGVHELDVRALHNGVEVALLLEWDDDSVDDLDGIRRYHDAVAVQLPVCADQTSTGPASLQIAESIAPWPMVELPPGIAIPGRPQAPGLPSISSTSARCQSVEFCP
jgi:hypothetical protein